MRLVGVPAFPAAQGSRWSVSLWGLARGGGQAGGSPLATPQLSAGQFGARLAWRTGDQSPLALVGRIAAATGTRQREAAIGIEWRPSRLPLRLVAEQRIAIEQSRGGAALAIIGGVGDVALGRGWRLDGYAQGGVIARDGGDGYADGAIRVSHPVARIGRATLDIGVGGWGAAQRGAARLDAGPAAGLTVPAAGGALRLAIEWRQRVAGDARPGSGPALSAGADF